MGSPTATDGRCTSSTKANPRPIFEFLYPQSVGIGMRRPAIQTISQCSRTFDQAPQGALKPAETLTTVVHNAGTAISRAPEIPSIPSRRLANNVDVPKVLTWLGAFLIAFGIFGWISGVSTAQPIEGAFEYIGLFTVAIGMILAAALVRRFFPSAGPVVLNILQLKWLFAPINGNRRKTLIWVASAIVCGVGIGGVGGYLIGLQTGQAVVNALETLGKIVVITVSVILALLIGWEVARNSGKRRRGGWRPRSSYRKKSQ